LFRAEADKFEHGVRNGDPYLDWTPKGPRDLDKMTHVFAIASFKTGGSQWVILEKTDVDKVKNGLKYKSQIWEEHYAEMAKKTAVRKLCKMLPLSPEMVEVQEFDNLADEERSQGNHKILAHMGVIDADYTPA